MIPLLIIMVIQAFLFACIFLFGGTIRHLNNNSFDILTDRTLSRKNYLQNEMVQHWSNINPFEKGITDKIEDVLAEHNITSGQIDKTVAPAILNEVAEELLRCV